MQHKEEERIWLEQCKKIHGLEFAEICENCRNSVFGGGDCTKERMMVCYNRTMRGK